MLFISHRINTLEKLKNIPINYGIEFDVRDSNGRIIVEHDPYHTTDVLYFEDFIQYIKHAFMIINVKSEQIEYKILELLKDTTIDYFLLDCNFPMIYKLPLYSKLSIRFSEYESIETIRNVMKDPNLSTKIKWVWFDCFNSIPEHLNKKNCDVLKSLGLKICLVSPELHDRDIDIEYFKNIIFKENLDIDAICTKEYNICRYYPKIKKIQEFPNYYTDFKDVFDVSSERKMHMINITDSYFVGLTDTYPNVLIRSHDIFINPVRDKFMSLGRYSIYEDSKYFPKYINPITDKNDPICARIVENPVFYFIYNFSNYYHFIYDSVPILYHYLKYLKPLGVLLLVAPFKYKFIKETFQLLNIKESDIVYHVPGTIYKSMYIGNSLTHEGLSEKEPMQEIRYVYDIMISNALDHIDPSNNAHINPKIYISRRTWIHNDLSNIGTNYTTRRKLMNEDNLVETLVSFGFEEVFCENMSMVEKIKLFNRSDVIVGAIGGGMCNLVFSKKDTKVLCIVSPTFLEVNNRFVYSMNHTMITYIHDVTLVPGLCNVRIKTIGTEIEGEIVGPVDNDNNKYIINAGSNDTTGWSQDQEYNKMILHRSEFITLDNGLNSPWLLNINSLVKELDNLMPNLRNYISSKMLYISNDKMDTDRS